MYTEIRAHRNDTSTYEMHCWSLKTLMQKLMPFVYEMWNLCASTGNIALYFCLFFFCIQVLIENCQLDVGDDIVAIKSGIDWLGRQYGRPSRDILIRDLQVLRMMFWVMFCCPLRESETRIPGITCCLFSRSKTAQKLDQCGENYVIFCGL